MQIFRVRTKFKTKFPPLDLFIYWVKDQFHHLFLTVVFMFIGSLNNTWNHISYESIYILKLQMMPAIRTIRFFHCQFLLLLFVELSLNIMFDPRVFHEFRVVMSMGMSSQLIFDLFLNRLLMIRWWILISISEESIEMSIIEHCEDFSLLQFSQSQDVNVRMKNSSLRLCPSLSQIWHRTLTISTASS